MFSAAPRRVKIVEVSLRDGLQNLTGPVVATADKKRYFDLLTAAGLVDFEVTSFVHPGRVPQLADAEQFYPLIAGQEDHGLRLTALVPNEKQLQRAVKCGVRTIGLFTSPSDTFNRKNINRDVAESLQDIRKVAAEAAAHGMNIRGLVSMAFGCPDEGAIDEAVLLTIIDTFFAAGAYEVSLCDTVGLAGPGQVQEGIIRLKERFGLEKMAFHFHDTRGLAAANVLAALEVGAAIFDGSAGGLGGCPFARGSKGNLATETLVHLLESLKIDCGVDPGKLAAAADFLQKTLGTADPGC